MFKGNAVSTIDSGHYFYVASLQHIGLAVLSKDDYKVFRERDIELTRPPEEGEEEEEQEEGEEEATGTKIKLANYTDIYDYVSQLDGINTYKYMEADTSGGFTEKTISKEDINALIDYTDDTSYVDRRSDVSDKEKTIRKIQNSPCGCIYGCFASGATSLGTRYSVRIYFHKRHNERKDRVPSFKASTLFTAHPRRHSGSRYAHKQSLSKARVASKNEHAGDVGYVNVTEQDYSSMVSAPLKLIYNHNLGVWETGGAFMVTLLEDIDGAEILASDLDTGNLEGREPKDFYGTGRIQDLSTFTTGLAAPLQVQNKNPYAFGPNFIGTGDKRLDDGTYKSTYRVEKIRVVNRSANLFSKGELAIVHPIDGENILVKLGDAVVTERPPSWEGHWEFAKFLASSDDWFRCTNGDIIKETEVPEFIWRKIYADQTETRLLSIDYFQDNIFNQTGEGIPGGNLLDGPHAWGGTPDGSNTHRGRVNTAVGIGDSNAVALDSITFRDIPVFWGPVFPLGYKKSKVTINDKVYVTEQLPAEIATLGARGSDGSPIYDYQKVVEGINAGSSSQIHSARHELLNIKSGFNQAEGLSLLPSDENQIQFSFLSGDLYGHLDQNTEIITGSINNTAKRCRNFYSSIAQYTGYPKGTNLFGGGSGGRENFGMIAGTVQEAWSHLYSEAPTSYVGPKYDAYVTKEAQFYKPNGCYPMFGDGDSPYAGAGAVGLTAARRRLYKSGAFDLNVDTSQTFGTQGVFFGGGGGGNVSVTIIPGMFAWSNDNRGRRIEGTTVVWGSATDSIYSFGTGALHVVVWDGWPQEDTAWLPQYATPIHFNPSANAATDEEKEKTVQSWNSSKNAYEDTTITLAPTVLDIDYTVPTYGHKVSYTPPGSETAQLKWQYNTGRDGEEVENLTKIYSTTLLRPQENWIPKFDRRARILTGYGYFWDKKTIGVDKSAGTILTAGTDFSIDDILQDSRGVMIKVTGVDSDGGITSWTIARSSDTNNTTISKKRTLNHPVDGASDWDEIGEDFVPDDFPYTASFSGQGEEATISFANGIVYDKPMCDHPPAARSSMQRVSLPSTQGQRRVYGVKTSNISVEDNSSAELSNEVTESYKFQYPGSYEVFMYCHNDIGICLHNDPDNTTGDQYHNYITATFS